MTDVFRPFRSNPPALRKGIVIDTVRGRVRIRKYPKKRGKPRSVQTINQNLWFADVMRKLKLLPGEAVEFAMMASKGTGLYPRDVLMMQLTRSNVVIEDEPGHLLTQRTQGIWQVSFQGARLELAANTSLPTNTEVTPAWAMPIIDTAGLWAASNPNRLVIPGGVNIVRVEAGMNLTAILSVTLHVRVFLNGVRIANVSMGPANTAAGPNVSTGPLPVEPGDIIEARFQSSSNATLAKVDPTYLSLEILDASFPAGPNTPPS